MIIVYAGLSRILGGWGWGRWDVKVSEPTPVPPLPAFGGSTSLTTLSLSKGGIFDLQREGFTLRGFTLKGIKGVSWRAAILR